MALGFEKQNSETVNNIIYEIVTQSDLFKAAKIDGSESELKPKIL